MRFWSECGRVGGDVFFLVGDDAHGPAADAGVAAEQSFAVFGAVFLEFAAVDEAGDDFAHVVLLGGIAGEDAVEFVGRVKSGSCGSDVAEDGRIGRAHFVDEGADAFRGRIRRRVRGNRRCR